jgi:amino acid transporter
MQESSQPTLVRALGPFDLAAIAVNTIIGSAIFVLPATAAAQVGPWAPLSFLVCAGIILLLVLNFAAAASRFADTGGPYLYARKAFGEFISFEVGWVFWLGRIAAVGANYSVCMIYLGYFAPSLSQGWPRAAIITIMAMLIALANWRGVKLGSQIVNSFTIAKLLPLILVITAGLFFIDFEKDAVAKSFGAKDFLRSLFILVFAYGGFEQASIVAGETRNPKRDLPRALLSAIGVVTLIYVSMQFVVYRLDPAIGESTRPLARAAELMFGSWGASLIAMGAILSTCGYVFGASLAVPRLTFALAEHGQIPLSFARLHPVFRTPSFSIFFHFFVTWMLAIALGFLQLAVINVMARLVVSVVTCLAVLRFLRNDHEKNAFRLPGGKIIPFSGLGLAILLLSQASQKELLYGVLALAIGALLYQMFNRR